MLSPSLRRTLFYLPLFILGAEALLHLFQVVIGRIDYPFELEWMEGAILHQVLRVRHGEPLYGQPSMDFIPALYMPLYYYVSAMSAQVFGENLFALRVVSAVSALLTQVFVFLIARRISGSVFSGVLAVFFYALMFRHTAFWFDVARVDSLWTLLLAASLYCLLNYRSAPTAMNAVGFAVCSVLALFAKQATFFLFPFVALAIWCWLGWQALLRYLLFCIPLAAVGLALCWLIGGKDFFFYTAQMASTHGITLFGVRRFFEIVLLAIPAFWLAALVFCLTVGAAGRDRLGWVLLLLGFVFLSGLSRAYAGAFFNVLMPLYFFMAIAAAIGFSALVDCSEKSRLGSVLVVFLLLFLSVDFARFRYDPVGELPAAESRRSTEQLVQRIAAVDGNVCVTSHGYLAWLAGKHFCAHNTQVTDLVTGSDPALAQLLRDDAREKILGGYYRVLVLDREKELADLGLQFSEIPYTVTAIDYPHGKIRFPVNGYSPKLWLEFNGNNQPSQ